MMSRKGWPVMQARYWMVSGLALTFIVTGCGQRIDAPIAAVSQATEEEIGPHGGIITEVGPRAHVEIVLSNDTNLDIYFLDDKISKPVPVDEGAIEGFGVVADQGPIPTRLTLAQVSDSEASHFQASIPTEWLGKKALVVVPKVVIAGQRWHFDFEIDVPLESSRAEAPGESRDDDITPTGDSSPATTE